MAFYPPECLKQSQFYLIKIVEIEDTSMFKSNLLDYFLARVAVLQKSHSNKIMKWILCEKKIYFF